MKTTYQAKNLLVEFKVLQAGFPWQDRTVFSLMVKCQGEK